MTYVRSEFFVELKKNEHALGHWGRNDRILYRLPVFCTRFPWSAGRCVAGHVKIIMANKTMMIGTE
jgi:hypothetical protein